MSSKANKVIAHKVLKYPKNINDFIIYENYINRLRCNVKKWSLYPNFGENFLIQNRYDPTVKYKIIFSKYKNVRNAKFLVKKIDNIEEVSFNQNEKNNKLIELKNINQYKIMDINIDVYNNGNFYNLKDMNERISLKTNDLIYRQKLLGLNDNKDLKNEKNDKKAKI